MPDMERSERRARLERKKAKVKRIIESWPMGSSRDLTDNPTFVGRMANHHKPDCVCCKKGRNQVWAKGDEKLSMSERRKSIDYDEE